MKLNSKKKIFINYKPSHKALISAPENPEVLVAMDFRRHTEEADKLK
jgi:hypothetical protein